LRCLDEQTDARRKARPCARRTVVNQLLADLRGTPV
jgi:hypothetical protein